MAKFVADLHLHSSFARATSPNLNFDTLRDWARLKGIKLLSSADFTHPVWFRETREKLKESGNAFTTMTVPISYWVQKFLAYILKAGGKGEPIVYFIFLKLETLRSLIQNLVSGPT